MAVFDKSPRAPGQRVANAIETTERAECKEDDVRCGSSFETVDLDTMLNTRRVAPPPEGMPRSMVVPVLRSAVHENVLSSQLGAPTAEPNLAMFAPDPEQPTWIGSDPKLRTSRMARARAEGPKVYPSPSHRHGGGDR
jgi:hypothetical protein